MEDFVEYLIRHIVDKPNDVQVKELSGEQTVMFELRVAEGDIGKVIGRRGETARSLRTIIAAVAGRKGQRSLLEIVDDKNNSSMVPIENRL